MKEVGRILVGRDGGILSGNLWKVLFGKFFILGILVMVGVFDLIERLMWYR